MKDLRTLSHVPRWAVLRVIHRQSVADHSYYVAIYAGMLGATERMTGDEAAHLMAYALWHDVAEVFTSDMPGPVKRAVCDEDRLKHYENNGMLARFGISPKVSPKAQRLVKIADLIDEICYLTSEQRLGNQEVQAARDLATSRLNDFLQQTDIVLSSETKSKISVLILCEYGNVNLPT